MGILSGLKAVNSEHFRFDNYESNWWYILDISYANSMSKEIIKRCILDYAIGYCDGSRITVRPNLNSYAILFEKDGEQFWFHVEKWFIEECATNLENEDY
jgi:hypothetical protein